MIYDLLKNTEDVIQAFNPFYSDVEHQTLGKLSENTLYKSIAGLTLKVSSHFIFFSAFGSLLNLILFPLFFFFLCIRHYLGDRECAERAEAKVDLLQDEGEV